MPRSITPLDFVDPRTKAGDLLWPAQFGPVELAKLKSDLGAYGTAGQLQQRPSPEIGGMFKRHWWRFWQPAGAKLDAVPVKQVDGTIRMVEALELPPLDEQLHSWDMSYRDLKESDYVSGQHWGRSGARKFLLHAVKGQWDFPKTLAQFRDFVERFPAPLKLVENAANGPAIIWALESEITGLVAVVPEGSKESRAAACSPQVEAGNVFLPHPSLAPWVGDFIDEAANFPLGTHDDQVDAMAQALNRLTKASVYRLLPEFRANRLPGEPAEACHVIETAAIEPWWPHWLAVGTVPGMGAAIHWFAQSPAGQVYVYREALTSGTAEEVGVALAEGSIAEVQHTARLTAFLSPEMFDQSAAGKSFAAELTSGIEHVIGREATFTFALTEDERRMKPEAAWLSLQTRERKAQQARLFLRGVQQDRPGGWEHIRSMLRWWPIQQPETLPYDRDTARTLLAGPDGQAAMEEYLRHVDGQAVAEPLPGLLIFAGCRHLVATLSGLVKHEKKLDLATPSPIAESLLAGLMGHRENPEIRPPQEAYTASRLEQLQKRNPQATAQQKHMAITQAESDWKRKFAKPTKGFTFSRLPRRGR
jgi:predicted phage terminase large subunit-like protein